MIRLFIDTETSGLPDFKLPADHPSQPRMCQLAMVLGSLSDDGADFEYLERYEGIIRPDGWTMPEDVARIHGLTTEICAERGVPVREALDRYGELLTRADELLAFGVQFDTKILRGELRRAGLPDRFGEKPELCVMRAATPVCKIPPTEAMMATGRKTWKTPKLGEAHRILIGTAMENAHDAMADVEALIAVWRHLHGRNLLPASKVRESLPPEQRGAIAAAAKSKPAPAPRRSPASSGGEIEAF